jgi:hypothetical protein
MNVCLYTVNATPSQDALLWELTAMPGNQLCPWSTSLPQILMQWSRAEFIQFREWQ